jgi:Mn-containing catalase
MLATAVALNLEGAAPAVQEQITADDPMTRAALGGMNMKNFLTSGLGAMPVDSDGVPFDMSHVYASGNIAADMYANVAAEATGRALATRLYELTDDTGMRDMLAFLIARDTMHQQQWLAAIEDVGGTDALPIPDSFPQDQEHREFSYAFLTTSVEGGPPPPEGRWSSGPSIDGRGEFTTRPAEPLGGEPQLGPPAPQGHAQAAQMLGADGKGGGLTDTVKDAVTGS